MLESDIKPNFVKKNQKSRLKSSFKTSKGQNNQMKLKSIKSNWDNWMNIIKINLAESHLFSLFLSPSYKLRKKKRELKKKGGGRKGRGGLFEAKAKTKKRL